jgi:hypothetical protein
MAFFTRECAHSPRSCAHAYPQDCSAPGSTRML